MARKESDWRRYAAPTAFLAVATIAIVLIASALHHATNSKAPIDSGTERAVVTAAPTTTVGKRRFYTVVAGDTFGAIAAKTGTTIAELERLNPGVSSTTLHIGQKLRVA